MKTVSREKTALVLGGGGMFGAYQAGLWRVLAREFEFDLIAGASIGALNAWAFAGGCAPEEWVAQWLDFREAAGHKWRMPRGVRGGLVDVAAFEDFVRRHHARWQPLVPFAVALTRVPRLEVQAISSPHVRWQHLAASCAVPVFFPPYRIDGSWYADGGLLGAVPLWAAASLGATRIVGVNILPRSTSPLLGAARFVLRKVSRSDLTPPAALMLEPTASLGPMRDMIHWSRDAAARMIALGEKDARAALPRLRAHLAVY